MSKFSVSFECGNAAFEGGNLSGEVSRILRDIADQVEGGNSLETANPVRDVNGNDVGSFVLKRRRRRSILNQ